MRIPASRGAKDSRTMMAVEGQVERQGQALERRPEEQGPHPADAIGDPAGGEAADHAQAQHEGEHLRAVGHAVAEVARIGHDVHLRHGHRDTASQAGDHEQRLETGGRDAEPAVVGQGPSGRPGAVGDR
jgi:hypothetical protein